MVKKIAYVSSEFYIHGDKSIIKTLSKVYNVYWIIVFEKVSNLSKYYPEHIYQYVKEINLKNVLVIERKCRARNIRNMWNDYNLIIKTIKRFNPHYYLIQGYHDPYWLVLVRLFLGNNKVIYGIHNAIPHSNIGTIFHRISDLISFRIFRNYLFYSKTQEELFVEKYNKNTFYIDSFLKDYGMPNILKNKKNGTFLFFGTVHQYKGLDILLKASNELIKERYKFKLKIAGHFPNGLSEYSNFINNQTNLIIDNRIISNEEIPDLFTTADFLVLPYRDVTQAGPLLIAYNYNLPVIASNHSWFLSKIEHGKNGFIFKTEDFYDLKDILIKAIKLSDAEYQNIKKLLKEYVDENYSEFSMLTKYMKVLNKLN